MLFLPVAPRKVLSPFGALDGAGRQPGYPELSDAEPPDPPSDPPNWGNAAGRRTFSSLLRGTAPQHPEHSAACHWKMNPNAALVIGTTAWEMPHHWGPLDLTASGATGTQRMEWSVDIKPSARGVPSAGKRSPNGG